MLLFLLSLVAAAAAQDITFYNVSIFNGNGNKFDGTVTQGGYLQVVVNATLPPGGYTVHPGSCELWNSDNNSVVDIIGFHQADDDTFGCEYEVPESMPIGVYWVQVYVSGEAGFGRSKSFRMVESTSVSADCTTIPPFQPISSVNDANYTSLRIYGLHRVAPNNSFLEVKWFFIDYRNYHNVGIKNLHMSAINQDTAYTVDLGAVPVEHAGPQYLDVELKAKNITNGRWRIRANYSSEFERSGATVSTLSDVFFVMDFCGPPDSNSDEPNGARSRVDLGLRFLTGGLGLVVVSLFCL